MMQVTVAREEEREVILYSITEARSFLGTPAGHEIPQKTELPKSLKPEKTAWEGLVRLTDD